jgi:hypothetical protein
MPRFVIILFIYSVAALFPLGWFIDEQHWALVIFLTFPVLLFSLGFTYAGLGLERHSIESRFRFSAGLCYVISFGIWAAWSYRFLAEFPLALIYFLPFLFAPVILVIRLFKHHRK